MLFFIHYDIHQIKMGISKSLNITDPTQDADLIDQTHDFSVFRGKNGQEYQKYRVQNFTNDFPDRFYYRIKYPNDNLVTAFYLCNQFLDLEQLGNIFSCTTATIYSVVIQRIPYRLSDFTKLSSQEGITILKGALKGFLQVYKTIGLIFVKQSMIGINNQNIVKVWINSRFQLTHVEGHPVSYQNMNKKRGEAVMVDNIFQLIKLKVRSDSFWNDFCQKWQNLQHKTFQKAIYFVEQFITLNNIIIRSGYRKRSSEGWPTLDEQRKKSRHIQLQGNNQKKNELFELQSRIQTNFPRLQVSEVKTSKFSQQSPDKFRFKTQQMDRTTKSTFAQVRERVTNLRNQQNVVFMPNNQQLLMNGFKNNLLPQNYHKIQFRRENQQRFMVNFEKNHIQPCVNLYYSKPICEIKNFHVPTTSSDNDVKLHKIEQNKEISIKQVQSFGSQIKKMLNKRVSAPVSQIRKNDKSGLLMREKLSKSSIHHTVMNDIKNEDKKQGERTPGKIKYKHKSNHSLLINGQRGLEQRKLGQREQRDQKLIKSILLEKFEEKNNQKSEQSEVDNLSKLEKSRKNNEKQLEFSRISRSNSDISSSITYKDLRNLLKSIQRKKI